MKKIFNFLKKCVIVALLWLNFSNIMLPPFSFPFDPDSFTCQTFSGPEENPFDEIPQY